MKVHYTACDRCDERVEERESGSSPAADVVWINGKRFLFDFCRECAKDVEAFLQMKVKRKDAP